MEIRNARVLVTGGTSGIGFEIARLLRANGALVVICGRDSAVVQNIAEQIDVFGIAADVREEKDIISLFDFTNQKLGGLDVLINNAGAGYFKKLTETTTDDFTSIWETNVKGPFIAGRMAAKQFIAQKSGNIINIGSTAALRGFDSGSAYVASKFALTGLTECWRAELRPYNIRVMQINPSEVITSFGTKLGFETVNEEKKLKAADVAYLAHAMLAMSDIGFIPEASLWATNP